MIDDSERLGQGANWLSRRRFLKAAAAAAGASGGSFARVPLPAFAPDKTVSGLSGPAVVNRQPEQTMRGFGASGAWWPIDLAHFHPDVQEQIGALLFAPAPVGIGLSVFRYNIGGGATGVKNPSRAPETFLVRPGQYDWSRDQGGRTFLGFAQRYQVPVLVGFVNSAPALWTTNGACCGGYLRPGAEQDVAGYLGDIVTHFQDQGITLSYISPMNEPDYRFESCDQEGMAVPVAQRAALVGAVAEELARRAPYSRVIADESSQVAPQLLPEASQWLSAESAPRDLAALAHHLYDFPSNATLQAARQIGERFSLPLWSTEVCCFGTETASWGREYDPTIGNALVMANLVWQALTQANDAAFHWWLAASSAMGADPLADREAAYRPNTHGWNDGLIYYDRHFARNGNQLIYLTKRYWAMGNFSRYVRPGALRHDVAGVPDPLRVLAFSSDLGWTVIAINNAPPGTAPESLRLRLPTDSVGLLVPIEAVETSATSDLAPVALPRTFPGGVIEVNLPAQSITTFVLAARRPRGS